MCNLAQLHTSCNRGHIYSTNDSDITINPQTSEIAHDFNPVPISGLNGKMQEYPNHVNENINADGHFTTAGGGFNEHIALGTFMTTDSITEEGTCIHDNGFKPTNVDIPVELHIPQDSRLFNDENMPSRQNGELSRGHSYGPENFKRGWCHYCSLEHKFPMQ